MIITEFREIGKHVELRLHAPKNNSKLGIVFTHGAALSHWEVPVNNHPINIIKGYETETDFQKLYKSTILSPFPNRINKGQFQFNKNNYQLNINRPEEGHALHGFLYNKKFELDQLDIKKDKAVIGLSYKFDADHFFPFSFIQTVQYVWDGKNNLELSATIQNVSDDQNEMPYGIGWHPYFNLGGYVDDYKLTLPAIKKYLVDEKMIPTGETELIKQYEQGAIINESHFDDGFEFQENQEFNIHLNNPANNLSLEITASNEDDLPYRFIQIYTPKDRQSIALEPMTCLADAFNNQIGISSIAQGQLAKSKFKMHLKY